ncbi:MAG: hypothetical protein Q8R55_06960 [Candidatus Taylorbacteria bacterium]|nr:hypothetical protein [Candidatus Taylorbacteria bacterium]
MVIFCSRCGVKNTSEDKFCKDCGAKLAGSADAPKEEVKSEQPSAPASAPATPAKIPTETKANIVAKAIVQAIGSGLLLWLGWLILGAFLNSLNSNTNITPGGNTNGGGNPLCSNRCPANAPYYCTGQYYDADGIKRSLNGCLPTTAAQAGYSSWTGRCVKCP